MLAAAFLLMPVLAWLNQQTVRGSTDLLKLRCWQPWPRKHAQAAATAPKSSGKAEGRSVQKVELVLRRRPGRWIEVSSATILAPAAGRAPTCIAIRHS